MDRGPSGPAVSTSPGTHGVGAGRARSRITARARLTSLTALGVVASVLLTLLMTMPVALAPTARAAEPTLGLTVDSVTPTVAAPDEQVTIVVTVSNDAASAFEGGTLNVLLGTESLTTPARVTSWATNQVHASGRLVGQAEVGAIPAGTAAAITVTLERAGALTSRPYDVVPISLELGDSVTHTFVGVQRAKQYEPLSLAWLVPLLVQPSAALNAEPSRLRWEAWKQELAPGARLDRITHAFRGPSTTFAIDAALIDPPLQLSTRAEGGGGSTPTVTPPPTSTGTPTSEMSGVPNTPDTTDTPNTPDTTDATDATDAPNTPDSTVPTESTDPAVQENAIRAAGAARLRTEVTAASLGSAPVVLPAGDPDLVAIGTNDANDDLRDIVRDAVAEAEAVAGDLRGRADLTWTVNPRWDTETTTAYAATLGRSVATLVVDRDQLTWRVDQGNAGRRATDGTPLLVRDGALSTAALRATVDQTAGAGRQEFLAHSFALLQEAPGTARSVLVVPDRSVDPDLAASRALFESVAEIPWLAPTTVPAIQAQADAAPAATVAVASDTQTSGSPADSATNPDAVPAAVPGSPLDEIIGSGLADDLKSAAAIASIRVDREAVAADWRSRLNALTSTGWRWDPVGFSTSHAAVRAELAASENAVRVAPQTINFLADSGRVQVTVLNTLDVGVEDVRVRLVPGNPRLRIAENDKSVSIGPQSRATVTFQVTALASGPVNINATVLAPNGDPAGPTTAMLVRVSPTGAGIYWALGGITLLLLALGLWRGRRARQRAHRAGLDLGNAIQIDDDGQVVEEPNHRRPEGQKTNPPDPAMGAARD